MGYPLANIQKAIENGPVELLIYPAIKLFIKSYFLDMKSF